MGWKNWSSWSKGGISGILFGIILNVLHVLSLNLLNFRFLPTDIFPNSFISNFLFQSLSSNNILGIFFLIITILEVLIYWFLIGALFGWILEKRKSSDKKWIYTAVIVILVILTLGYIIANTSYSKITITPSNEGGQNIPNVPENRALIKNGGACVTEDAQTLAKTCTFKLKENCNGNFNEGLLCTAEQLGTECAPTTRNLIIETKNYFIDSCGNQANPYDMPQYTNKTYWTNSVN